MRLTERQAKQLLSDFGLRFSPATLANSPDAAAEAVLTLNAPAVLKAQTPFGGRGKAGAVRFVANADEAKSAARVLLGLELKGFTVNTISIEPCISFTREIYLGVAWDTASRQPVALLNSQGGMDVESSAESMHRFLFDPWSGMRAFEGREWAVRAGFYGRAIAALGQWFELLSQAFLRLDAVLIEINPLVETSSGDFIGLDARIEIDDDSFWRQTQTLRALGEVVATSSGRPATPLELEAQRIDATDHRGVAGRVVEFDGNLALLIGGGGASLTVFDAVRRHGGNPANYCEIGGNPTEKKVAALTALLLAKPCVKHLAVIMNVVNNTRADVIARGVLLGLKEAGRHPSAVLAVFRVPGSWEQEAAALLAEAGVSALGREVSLDQAAWLAVKRSKQNVD